MSSVPLEFRPRQSRYFAASGKAAPKRSHASRTCAHTRASIPARCPTSALNVISASSGSPVWPVTNASTHAVPQLRQSHRLYLPPQSPQSPHRRLASLFRITPPPLLPFGQQIMWPSNSNITPCHRRWFNPHRQQQQHTWSISSSSSEFRYNCRCSTSPNTFRSNPVTIPAEPRLSTPRSCMRANNYENSICASKSSNWGTK